MFFIFSLFAHLAKWVSQNIWAEEQNIWSEEQNIWAEEQNKKVKNKFYFYSKSPLLDVGGFAKQGI
jgi:hypothetical protein